MSYCPGTGTTVTPIGRRYTCPHCGAACSIYRRPNNTWGILEHRPGGDDIGGAYRRRRADTWTCGDCGNNYDHSVQYCPNTALDQAVVTTAREALT